MGWDTRDGMHSCLPYPPFAAAYVASVGLSVVADKYRAWSMCCLVSYILAGATFIVQGGPESLWSSNQINPTEILGTLPPTAFKARYVSLCFGAMFCSMPVGPSPAWFTSNLRDTNATTFAIPFGTTISIGGSVIGRLLVASRLYTVSPFLRSIFIYA